MTTAHTMQATGLYCNHPPRCHGTRLAVSALFVMLLTFCAPSLQAQGDATTITIGTASGQINTDDDFSPLSDYLDAQVPGYRFQVIGYRSIQDLMTAVRNGNLDFAFMTPAAYVELSLDNDLRLLSTITKTVGDGYSPWLAGAVFTLAARDDINTLADARDKRVVALSEIALGGWLSALREWHDLGLQPGKDFIGPDFIFSYASIVDQVCSGAADVGIIAANMLPAYRDQCGEDLKVLPRPGLADVPAYAVPHSTRLYPEVGFVMVGTHDEEFIRLLTQSLLAIEHDSPIAMSVNIGGFTAPLPYTEVQAMMEELRLGPWGRFGTVSLRQFLLDNIYLVTLAMTVIMALILAGFINAHRLSRRFRESESYRKLVFEGSHIPMVVVDPQRNVFIDMNPAAVRQYGYNSKDELINQPLMTLTDPKQDIDTSIEDAFENTRRQVMQQGQATFDWRHIRPNGERWIARIHLMAFDSPDGKLIQATVEDITQQKLQEEEHRNLEQQLVFSQRMESIGRLAGGIAHDFNNLLTIINGYCEVLLLDPVNAKSAKILQQIRKAGIRASDLTHQLLTFSRRQAIRQIPVNVNGIIRDAAEMIRSVLGEGIRLELDLMRDPRTVLSDPGQLQQVLLNLVVNAKDAMPEGGVLKIATAETFITPRNAQGLEIGPGDYLEISVSDTGIGMSPGILQHIFEPFFTTKENSGTGLGLSTVYGIVQQSLGTIQVASTEGRGTTFRVLLPQTDDTELQAEEDDGQPLPAVAEPFNILVVEDQQEVLDYTMSVLRTSGYGVYTAMNGAQALEKMAGITETVHLLVTDVVMEGMSGGELAEIFSDHYPDIPVLFISGYPGDELARYGVRQGMHEFLAKPFTPKELLHRVDQILKSTVVFS